MNRKISKKFFEPKLRKQAKAMAGKGAFKIEKDAKSGEVRLNINAQRCEQIQREEGGMSEGVRQAFEDTARSGSGSLTGSTKAAVMAYCMREAKKVMNAEGAFSFSRVEEAKHIMDEMRKVDVSEDQINELEHEFFGEMMGEFEEMGLDEGVALKIMEEVYHGGGQLDELSKAGPQVRKLAREMGREQLIEALKVKGGVEFLTKVSDTGGSMLEVFLKLDAVEVRKVMGGKDSEERMKRCSLWAEIFASPELREFFGQLSAEQFEGIWVAFPGCGGLIGELMQEDKRVMDAFMKLEANEVEGFARSYEGDVRPLKVYLNAVLKEDDQAFKVFRQNAQLFSGEQLSVLLRMREAGAVMKRVAESEPGFRGDLLGLDASAFKRVMVIPHGVEKLQKLLQGSGYVRELVKGLRADALEVVLRLEDGKERLEALEAKGDATKALFATLREVGDESGVADLLRIADLGDKLEGLAQCDEGVRNFAKGLMPIKLPVILKRGDGVGALMGMEGWGAGAKDQVRLNLQSAGLKIGLRYGVEELENLLKTPRGTEVLNILGRHDLGVGLFTIEEVKSFATKGMSEEGIAQAVQSRVEGKLKVYFKAVGSVERVEDMPVPTVGEFKEAIKAFRAQFGLGSIKDVFRVKDRRLRMGLISALFVDPVIGAYMARKEGGFRVNEYRNPVYAAKPEGSIYEVAYEVGRKRVPYRSFDPRQAGGVSEIDFFGTGASEEERRLLLDKLEVYLAGRQKADATGYSGVHVYPAPEIYINGIGEVLAEMEAGKEKKVTLKEGDNYVVFQMMSGGAGEGHSVSCVAMVHVDDLGRAETKSVVMQNSWDDPKYDTEQKDLLNSVMGKRPSGEEFPFFVANHHLQVAEDDQSCALYSTAFNIALIELIGEKGSGLRELMGKYKRAQSEQKAIADVMREGLARHLPQYYDRGDVSEEEASIEHLGGREPGKRLIYTKKAFEVAGEPFGGLAGANFMARWEVGSMSIEKSIQQAREFVKAY